MRVSQLLQHGFEELKSVGISNPELDVYILLGHVLKKTRTELLLAVEKTVSVDQEQHFINYLARRKGREPVAYILGEREFWSLSFYVSREVLIPRPETEYLLERVLGKIKNNKKLTGPVVDICCGSGVIAVVLALELKKNVIAVDISRGAINTARRNVLRHGVDKRITFIQSDLLTGLRMQARFSLIVSNPPYVVDHELEGSLEPEVVNYEPHLALNGGKRGLEIIKRLRVQVVEMLAPGGCFFMEIGADQGKEIRELFTTPYQESRPFDYFEILQDYSGRDRVVCCGFNP